MKFNIFQESRQGGRRVNQDRIAYTYSRDALLMVLADGMGGHKQGEVAAQIAVQSLVGAFRREARPLVPDPVMFLSRSITAAHYAILDHALDERLPEPPHTTLVACVVQEGVAHWAHAGDSRLYLVRDGRIVARTNDHSRVQLLVEQGVLDEAGAARHPDRNRVYSCLGSMHAPQIEFSRRTPLACGDVVALCSDGVWSPLGNERLAAGLVQGVPEKVVPRLLDEAEEIAGAGSDNLSLIALDWQDNPHSDLPDSEATRTVPMGAYATRIDGRARKKISDAPPLSDEEIDSAIRDIQIAIRKTTQ